MAVRSLGVLTRIESMTHFVSLDIRRPESRSAPYLRTFAIVELNTMFIIGNRPVARRSSVISEKPFLRASCGVRFSMGLPSTSTSPSPRVK